jgi:hypothetical protein
MSTGLSPKLPLTKDPQDGYALNKDYIDLVKQNLKMLLLTAPGERIMEPDFGIGLRNYLFENNTNSTYSEIETRIREQVNFYMPFIEVQQVDFGSPQSDNTLTIAMGFRIIPFDLLASMEISVETN